MKTTALDSRLRFHSAPPATNHHDWKVMKTIILALILLSTSNALWAQTPPATNAVPRLRAFPRFGAGTNGHSALAPFPGLPATPTLAAPALSAGPTGPAEPGTPSAAAAPNGAGPSAPAAKATAAAEIPAFSYNLQGVDVNQVLDLYADLVGRTILRAGLPQASIVLHTQSL